VIAELSDFLKAKEQSADTISIVFGREESGLTNDEMKLCDITSTIPMAISYPSLNLSHAVMLYAYELSNLERTNEPYREGYGSDSFKQLKSKITGILHSLGINENDNRFGRILERLAFLENDDIHLLHTLSSLIDEKLKEIKG
jgi:tRNA/rRNA methyltransferase